MLAAGRVLHPLASRAGVPLLVNEREAVAHQLHADGLHLPERAPLAPRGALTWIAASAHDATGVRRRSDADVLVLGPLGHVEAKNPPMTDEAFTNCVQHAVQPVLALGGIRTSADVARALRLGAFGIAVLQTISHAEHGGTAMLGWLEALNEARAGFALSTKLRP